MGAHPIPKGERAPTATDCYRFVLSRPEVDVCMTGPANAAQMDEALEALRARPDDGRGVGLDAARGPGSGGEIGRGGWRNAPLGEVGVLVSVGDGNLFHEFLAD